LAELNDCVARKGCDPRHVREPLNRWIAHETARAAREVTAALERFQFNEAAGAAYRFVWNVYCDWYLELAKPLLAGLDAAAKDETRATTAWARDEILKLLHPFMPFVTEELWGVTAVEGGRDSMLILERWPQLAGLEDVAAEAEIGWVVDLVTAIRSVRAEMNVPPGAAVPLVLVGIGGDAKARAQRFDEYLRRLARLSGVSFADVAPEGSIQLVVRGDVAALPLAGVIDVAAEKSRLEKELAKVKADVARADAKLANPDFVERAPEEVVEGEREKREELEARRLKIVEAVTRLSR
jgi:valyl-tRNA synthetase